MFMGGTGSLEKRIAVFEKGWKLIVKLIVSVVTSVLIKDL